MTNQTTLEIWRTNQNDLTEAIKNLSERIKDYQRTLKHWQCLLIVKEKQLALAIQQINLWETNKDVSDEQG